MIPGAFDYHRPASLSEAIGLLGKLNSEARVIAGGHSLIPMMKLRLAAPSHLVDLAAIAELKGVHLDGGEVVIGAMTTQHELLASELLAAQAPIIRETSALIADPQVRYMGTIGGNVANGDPGNDMPALMMALGASYVLRGPGGERRVAAREYYQGAYTPPPFLARSSRRSAFPPRPPVTATPMKSSSARSATMRPPQRRSILTVSGGRIATCAIGLTNVADTALFAAAAAQAVVGTALDKASLAKAAARSGGDRRPRRGRPRLGRVSPENGGRDDRPRLEPRLRARDRVRG